MDKIWLRDYPANTSDEIDLTEFSSINQMLASAFRRYPRHPAYRNFGTTLTYSQIDRASRDFAAWLRQLPGLRTGARVALMMPNILQYPIALFGALRAGMTVVNVNPLYTARELEHQLIDSGAEVIVIVENSAHVLQSVLRRTQVRFVVTTQIGDLLDMPKRWFLNLAVKRVKKLVPPWRIESAVSFGTALRLGRRGKFDEAAREHGDIAFLQYTSATTGSAKGAILTHGNVVANVLQISSFCRGVLQEGAEVFVTALPLYHAISLVVNCLVGVKFGALLWLITNPRDLSGLVRDIKSSRFTAFVGVNTLFEKLFETPGFREIDFSRVKFGAAGGAPVQTATAQKWQAITGSPMVEAYGLTEASCIVTCNRLDAPHNGAAGLPVPRTELRICGEDGCELPAGSPGEICIRGPQVCQGYWHRSEETANAFSPDGWFRTGDIGVMDENGFVRITDRKKDMIIVSGFNVYPTEVENVIATLPGVAECGVVGVPDPVAGEAVQAFIVRSDPSLSQADVIAFCRNSLTHYKVPKLVQFCDDLPKSAIGKVLRRELRSKAQAAGVGAAG